MLSFRLNPGIIPNLRFIGLYNAQDITVLVQVLQCVKT
jgi:hypothetical protein